MTPASRADRLVDAVGKLRIAVEGLQQLVDDDHPDLILCRFALALRMAQMNQPENAREVEKMLRDLIPLLEERYGLQNSKTQEAAKELVFLLEEQGKDAEEWRKQLLVEKNLEDTTAPFQEQSPLENFVGEKWVSTDDIDELLRGLLAEKYRLIAKLAASRSSAPWSGDTPRDSSTSSRPDTAFSAHPPPMPATESSVSASGSDSSSDNLQTFHQEMAKKRQEREQ